MVDITISLRSRFLKRKAMIKVWSRLVKSVSILDGLAKFLTTIDELSLNG